MNKVKSREIPFSEYFENIQREYIVAELRSKIYPREKDKKYYVEREMAGKRKTIEDISLRNNLPNIFSNEEKRKRYYSEVYNNVGLPNFIYRSDEDRLKRNPIDIINYFYRGVVVSVETSDGVREEGRVVFTNIKTKTVVVKISGQNITFSFDKVTRNLK